MVHTIQSHIKVVFFILFKIEDLPSLVSQVSSSPRVIHVCSDMVSDSLGIGGLEVHIVHVCPGQMFKVPVVLYQERMSRLYNSPEVNGKI